MMTIWASSVDNDAYIVSVYRRSADTGTGQLVLKEALTGKVLLERIVPLSFGAMFGPDVADIADWQEMACDAIDSYEDSFDA